MRCARDECGNTELTTKTATLRARSRVHVVLRVDSLDLGFHVVIGVGRLNVEQDGFVRQLHFTTQTQHQVQSSFLLDVVVRLCRCDRPLNLYSKFLHISHRENVSFEVLSLQSPLYPFPLAFQLVHEASCQPPSPLPIPGAFASLVGGGGSGDCQLLADIPCNVVGGGPVNPSGERGVDCCCC